MSDLIGRLFLDSFDKSSAACRHRALFIGLWNHRANLVLPGRGDDKPRSVETTGVATEKLGLFPCTSPTL